MAEETSHFDKRSSDYDQEEVHQRIVSLLVEGAELKSGFHVLDIATGTGLAALKAAQLVGPAGKVTGIDTSSGMLEEAFKKAKRAGLRNAKFMLGDAERLIFPADSFDYIFCASALVLISNMPKALQLWSRFLKPHGGIAFDTPSRPFGISQRVVDIAAAHGVHLAYADVADTPEKCRSLLEKASIKTVHVATELVNSEPMTLSKAIAFWDEHTDHPAWQNLKHASEKTRDVIHTQYIADVTAAAVNGYVPNRVALNFTYGRKPGSAARARS